ncbi:hypothetical protein NFI96_016563 [Prochilodus magdalenae]|nr:hypothetical protein NFI96_016563 [Prochilodus magdalenae]
MPPRALRSSGQHAFKVSLSKTKPKGDQALSVAGPRLWNRFPIEIRCVTAQHGVQRRRVRCVRTANGTAVTERICEFFSPRPALEQACLIPCPLDCVVSDYSSWSGCSRTCGVGLQHRTRQVLAAPMYGGSGCPNLTQTRPCGHQLPCMDEGEHRYSLKVGSWSECRLPQHKDLWMSGRTTLDFSAGDTERNTVKRHLESNQDHHHHHHQHHHYSSKTSDIEIGYQTRQVRCMASDGKNVMLRVVLSSSQCSKAEVHHFVFLMQAGTLARCDLRQGLLVPVAVNHPPQKIRHPLTGHFIGNTYPELLHTGHFIGNTYPELLHTGHFIGNTYPELLHTGHFIGNTYPELLHTGHFIGNTYPELLHTGHFIRNTYPELLHTGHFIGNTYPELLHTGHFIGNTYPELLHTGHFIGNTYPELLHTGHFIGNTYPELLHTGHFIGNTYPELLPTGHFIGNTYPERLHTGHFIGNTYPELLHTGHSVTGAPSQSQLFARVMSVGDSWRVFSSEARDKDGG